jgi:hypothetical protein
VTDAVADEPGPSLVCLRVVRPGKPAVWFCSDPHYGPSSSRERADGHVIQDAPLGVIPAWSHSRHLARETARAVPRLPLLTVLTVSEEPLKTHSLPCFPGHAPVRRLFRENLATKSGTEAVVPPAQLQNNNLQTCQASEILSLETTPIPYLHAYLHGEMTPGEGEDLKPWGPNISYQIGWLRGWPY